MDSKPWYMSKTIWVNALTFAATVASLFGLDLGLDDATKATIATGVLALVNVVLRAVTRKAVTG